MIRSCGGGEPPPYRSVGNKNVRDAFTHRLHADCANIPRSVASSGGRSPRPRPAVLCPPGPPPRVTWRHRQTWASVPRASQPTHVRRASSVRGVRSPGLVRQCLLGAQPQTPPGGASPPGPPSCGCVGVVASPPVVALASFLPWGAAVARPLPCRSLRAHRTSGRNHTRPEDRHGGGADERGLARPGLAPGTSLTPPLRTAAARAVRSPGNGRRAIPTVLARPLIRPPVIRALIQPVIRALVRPVVRAGDRACRVADARAGRHTARVERRAADLEDPEAARRPPRSAHR
jgi:hypothetical protein